MTEIWRVVKPGGRIGISVPHGWPERICWMLSEAYYNTPGGHVRIFKQGALRREFEAMGFVFDRKHLAHGLHSPYWWLKCAVGVTNETNLFVRAYKKLLEKEILQTRFGCAVSALADPLMGKSIVFYFDKPAANNDQPGDKRGEPVTADFADPYFDGARQTILRLQNTDGAIPWFKNGVIDPWNHLEAAMGLNLLGERAR